MQEMLECRRTTPHPWEEQNPPMDQRIFDCCLEELEGFLVVGGAGAGAW